MARMGRAVRHLTGPPVPSRPAGAIAGCLRAAADAAVAGVLASCVAELKRVQWPDRETLIQASAITLIFITIMAAYLGVLDAVFNWLVQRII